MTVLILTSEEDVTADMVVLRLGEAGVPVVRLDPADLTNGVALSGEYAQGACRGHLSVGGRLVSINGLRSVWVRRPGVPAARAAQPSAWLTEESSQALYGMLRCSDARWMNHPDAARRARHKPWQLHLAQRSGLPVPATLVTTFPQAAREFAERFPDLVVKPVSGAHPQEPPRAVPTSRVAPDTDFTAVAFGPTLLQRRDPQAGRHPAHRRRRHPAGRPQARRSGRPSGRRGRALRPRRSLPGCPRTCRRAVEGVLRYMTGAELAYGAFDFAEDSDGIWWFLECNQSGQFGFVEMDTGQPIAATIADWLAGDGDPGRRCAEGDRSAAS